jgi:hypothetical protein
MDRSGGIRGKLLLHSLSRLTITIIVDVTAVINVVSYPCPYSCRCLCCCYCCGVDVIVLSLLLLLMLECWRYCFLSLLLLLMMGYWRYCFIITAVIDVGVLTLLFYHYCYCRDRLCGLVVRVLGYRSGGPGSIPGTTKKKKYWVWNGVHSASWVQLRSYLIEK